MECWVKFKAVSEEGGTEDNLFLLERLIEMVKGRKQEIFVTFLDMEKAYDIVNKKKLFEVMRCYVVHEKLVILIQRIYDGSMVKFELEKVTTGWCKSDSGVRRLVISPFEHICQGIRKSDEKLCTWSQICSGGKGWCHGMEESNRSSICR